MKKTQQNIIQHRDKFKQIPGVSQALWLIPIVGVCKNLRDTLMIQKDSITDRPFNKKEQLFKTLSGICSLASRWVVGYNITEEKELLDTLIIIWGLQSVNWTSYAAGVYYSGELQNILQKHKTNIYNTTQKIMRPRKKKKN